MGVFEQENTQMGRPGFLQDQDWEPLHRSLQSELITVTAALKARLIQKQHCKVCENRPQTSVNTLHFSPVLLHGP